MRRILYEESSVEIAGKDITVGYRIQEASGEEGMRVEFIQWAGGALKGRVIKPIFSGRKKRGRGRVV